MYHNTLVFAEIICNAAFLSKKNSKSTHLLDVARGFQKKQ